jgi:hypothetical protein
MMLVYSNDEEIFMPLPELCDNVAWDTDDVLDVGSTVYVGTAKYPSRNRIIDTDDIITIMGERAYDIGGDYAEDFPDISRESIVELNALLDAWFSKNCTVNFYEITNVVKRELTKEDFDQ